MFRHVGVSTPSMPVPATVNATELAEELEFPMIYTMGMLFTSTSERRTGKRSSKIRGSIPNGRGKPLEKKKKGRIPNLYLTRVLRFAQS
jgi:hypothetical protein